MSSENSSVSPFNSRDYREVLGCFGTGVCLILTEDAEGRVRGITANSFSSVSLHPPIILWSVDIHSDRRDLFVDAPRFSVNFLKAEQRDISRRFAAKTDAVLETELTDRAALNVPVFNQALGHIVCETGWRQKAGDHIVIFGNVKGYHSSEGDGLGFFRGHYQPLTSKES